MSLPMYDRAIALIAGNILAGQGQLAPLTNDELLAVAEQAVRIARAIVGEVERTEPKGEL